MEAGRLLERVAYLIFLDVKAIREEARSKTGISKDTLFTFS